jgi:predicted TIM-barrel fold metal-dependent hydrolase
MADLKLLAEKDLSLDILLDGPRRFGDVARLAGALPGLRMVLGHLPFDPPRDEATQTRFRDDLRSLSRFPLVYAKVSGVVRCAGGRVRTDASFYKPASMPGGHGPDGDYQEQQLAEA